MSKPSSSAAQAAITAIWHIEAAKIIGRVARIVRDVGLAEEFAQDALVSALERWPTDGVPENPGAWLMTAAKRRALDHLRHEEVTAGKAGEFGCELDFQHELTHDTLIDKIDASLDAWFDKANQATIDDDLLRLVFTACHPVLSPEARCALTLRVMGGLSTDEIARAYLKSEATIAQRIVRAKRTLAVARVPFEVPRGWELEQRLASVLEVIYLIFNEGYSATSGDDWMRPTLCEEALRLGRVLAGLMPEESEVLGLVALMEIQSSRFAARVSPSGEPILLLDQNRARWDHLLIRRGLDALARAEARPVALGPYALQAAIAACHARAQSVEQTDWGRIAALYDALAQTAPSPVITLNRAVAVAMAFGPLAGLEVIDTLRDEPSLNNYHLLPSVRGDLLVRLDRFGEARTEFERAAKLTRNARERVLLLDRAMRCCKESIGPAQ